jgi:hypothetical protein
MSMVIAVPSVWLLAKMEDTYANDSWLESFESHLELAKPEADQFTEDPTGFMTKLLTDAGFQVNGMKLTMFMRNLVPLKVPTSKEACQTRYNIKCKHTHIKTGKDKSNWTTECTVDVKCMEMLPLVPLVP